MSLAFGYAPFARQRGEFDFSAPEHVRYWEPWPRRMRAVFAGRTVLDSQRGIVLHETGHLPQHFYPLEDLDQDLLSATEPDQHGRAQFSVRAGQRTAPGAVTAFSDNDNAIPPLHGHVSVDFAAMDRWFEEDEPLYGHVRDPYHRVDVRTASRHVVVRHAGRVIAESTRPKLLFETSTPTRYYLPFSDVDLGVLERSDTVSQCPYKGDGQHWHLHADGQRVSDAAWSLPHPLPEGLAAAEHICFYPHKVDLEVDGRQVTA